MAKKKQEEAPAGAPAWMATFSDLMNLLLCFFVLLFSMSSVDTEKFQQVIASLQSNFSVLPSGGATIGEGEMVGNGISQLQELSVYFNEALQPNNSNSDETADGSKNTEGDEGGDGNSDFLREYEEAGLSESEKMAEEIQEKLEQAGIADQVSVDFNQQFVLLTMNGAILFKSGKADVQNDAKPILSKIAKIISEYNEKIIEIEGHTDNVPISRGGRFESNEVLSFYRALSVADYIMDCATFDPAMLKYSGRGDAVPIADNSTAKGRAKNRRVEIRVYNSYYSNR